MKDFNCPRCNSTVVINRSSILLSNPEKYQVECVSCQWYGYLVCDDVGRILTDREIQKIKNTTDICNTYSCYENCNKCVEQFILDLSKRKLNESRV